MLKLIRGVTQSIAITITDDDSNIYKLQSGEVLRLGIKRNPQNTDYDVKKEVSSEALYGDSYDINFAPEDTSDLNPSPEYRFDVGLQTSDGNFYMIIPCSKCVILPAVTAKEAAQ